MKYSLFLIFFYLLLIGCGSPIGQASELKTTIWKYDDLRIIDPVDAQSPVNDIIAVYTRIIGDSIEIRIDFLDHSNLNDQDIYIPIDTIPGGLDNISLRRGAIRSDLKWDYLIVFQSKGSAKVIDQNYTNVYGTELLISRDSSQDKITIRFNRNKIPIDWFKSSLQVFGTVNESEIIIDQTLPVPFGNTPPGKLRLVFLFWNVFDVKTPAETLRSWSGAHSGPMRTRHGLKYLLEAADETDTPIFFTDFLRSEQLSALDYIGALEYIRKLEKKEIIGLIDTNQDFAFAYKYQSIDNMISNERNTVDEFGLKSNVNTKSKIEKSYLLLNGLNYFDSMIYKLSNYDYAQFIDKCPLSLEIIDTQALTNGISLDCKISLINAFSSKSTSIFWLGGDFSSSLLGNPTVSIQFFNFIKSHPWIVVSNIVDFNSLQKNSKDRSSDFSQPQSSENQRSAIPKYIDIQSALFRTPQNEIGELANQIYLNMSRSYLSSKPESILVQNYIGQIGFFIEASKWAQNPNYINTCSVDLDFDDKPECTLANNHIFVIIEPVGGYIVLALYVENTEVHQIIGPSWEFQLGISDPTEWNIEDGILSDPKQILGAVADEPTNWNEYESVLSKDAVTLMNKGNGFQKKYSINDHGIHIEAHNEYLEIKSKIPIVLDPWIRFKPSWSDLYYMETSSHEIKYGLQHLFSITITSSIPLMANSFFDSRSKIIFPEDPDFNYPPGHYLPYPLTVFESRPTKDLNLDIQVNP